MKVIRSGFIILMLMALATSALAQASTGNIFGTVVDSDGAALPGVTVTLVGPAATQVFVTDSGGRFRFLSLDPGSYTLSAELAGFGNVVRSGVVVNLGRSTNVELQVNPALEETIVVTADTPLLDVRKTGTGATMTEIELEEIPNSRDPWVILQQVPGVLMDRINVGGNESGQQSQFVSKGSVGDQATFNVDGVNITDMAATGSSPSYYDFGSFEEIQVSTGGTDPRIATPGAQVNIVTKRGTNSPAGSARYYVADGEYQTDPEIPEEALGYLAAVNEIDLNREWGGEVGGALVRDRLWLWGAYADQQIDLFVAQPAGQDVRFSDKTTLETLNLKLNGQLTTSNSAAATYSDNDKIKFGRNASPSRPPETTWNQSGYGPKGIWKIEDTHIFNPNFYMTGLYSKVNGGFQLIPNAGANCTTAECALQNSPGPAYLDLGDSIWQNTYQGVFNERPQDQYRLDASNFFETGSLSHELRYGLGYRDMSVATTYFWPGDQYVLDYDELGPRFGLPTTFGGAVIFRGGSGVYDMTFSELYAGDTILMGDFTFQVGARWELQQTSAHDSSIAAHPLLPDVLPAWSATGESFGEMEWETISPRLGVTYAVGESKQTLVRAAYNRYVDQLGGNSAAAGNNGNFTYQYLYYYFNDLNDNHIAETSEIYFEGGPFDNGIYGWYGIDPENPSDPIPAYRYDPSVDAPTTDELILGVEHELTPSFVVGLSYTHRDLNDFLWSQGEKTRGAGDFYTRDDYVLGGTLTATLPDGTISETPYYQLKDGLEPARFSVIRNRPGYSQTYDGIELSAVKRLSNRWMLRGNLSLNDWTQNVDEDAIIDPTVRLTSYGCSVCDGATVVQGSGSTSGAKGGIYINSEWAYTITGLYQIPVIETNFGVNISGRQGYPILYVHETPFLELEGGRKSLLLDEVGDRRFDDIHTVDLRLSKDFSFGPAGLQISVDAFNVTNEQDILQRNLALYRADAPQTTANRITEMVSPRIFRFGARVTF